MEYERIHKVQMGVISPTKLRMKLLGARGARKDEGGRNSSRASPTKHEDSKNAMNSLLSQDLEEEGDSAVQTTAASEVSGLEGSGNQASKKDLLLKDKPESIRARNHNSGKSASYQSQPVGNLSTVHPVRSQEEDCNGYDSGHENGSASSFEFHRGERTSQHQVAGPFFRHVPSKWNDAEKWIVNRQAMNQSVIKKGLRNQGGRQMIPNWMRIPETAINQVGETKMVDSSGSSTQNVVEKFSFDPRCSQANAGTNGVSRSREERNHYEGCVSEVPIAETTVIPAIQSVSMRDVGTEMTPIPSQDPSRTGTPLGATTPSLSPMSSMPSTPKRGAPTSTPADATTDGETGLKEKACKTELSEKELQIKTRKEIAALGVQLGKMKIVSWASQAETDPGTPSLKAREMDQLVKAEYVARAAAWEDAEKSKHIARYKREELKIEAWESHQRAKFEAKMREIEAQVERTIALAQDRMLEKTALASQRAEAKRAAAEARRNYQAAKTSQQVEKIRQTGHVPSHHRCCSWFL